MNEELSKHPQLYAIPSSSTSPTTRDHHHQQRHQLHLENDIEGVILDSTCEASVASFTTDDEGNLSCIDCSDLPSPDSSPRSSSPISASSSFVRFFNKRDSGSPCVSSSTMSSSTNESTNSCGALQFALEVPDFQDDDNSYTERATTTNRAVENSGSRAANTDNDALSEGLECNASDFDDSPADSHR